MTTTCGVFRTRYRLVSKCHSSLVAVSCRLRDSQFVYGSESHRRKCARPQHELEESSPEGAGADHHQRLADDELRPGLNAGDGRCGKLAELPIGPHTTQGRAHRLAG